MKYEYETPGRRVVATSDNKKKWPQCHECGDKKPSLNVTTCSKYICNACRYKGEEWYENQS